MSDYNNLGRDDDRIKELGVFDYAVGNYASARSSLYPQSVLSITKSKEAHPQESLSLPEKDEKKTDKTEGPIFTVGPSY